MNKLEFYYFNLMAYPFVPSDESVETTWVNFSNSHYDPRVGKRLYEEYLDQFQAAEKMGFDGVIVNEHHASVGGGMPAPNIMASYIAARTQQVPIGIIGNALPLHMSPIRIAEEIAMLDVISGGRIISGFVVGTGMEYFSHPVKPTEARERFWEAHDLILEAWTRPGPFAWQGKYYNLPSVNPWPQPLQKPYPEIWVPGLTSPETIDRVAQLGHRYMTVFAPQFMVKRSYQMFREACEKHGTTCRPNQLLATVPTYVAETDAQAHREARPHLLWLFHMHLRVPPHIFFPPGYMNQGSFGGMVRGREKYKIKDYLDMTYEDLIKDGLIIVGSPKTVIERLEEYCDDVGAGGIIGAGSPFGSMPHWMAMKNMQLLAEEVMPHFREADGKPNYMRQEATSWYTRSEFGATVPKDHRRTAISLNPGEKPVDALTAHIPE